MGIGSVTSMNSMSSMQMTMTRSTDVKSKNIQKEITDIQQQMQRVSSKEELSVDEKENERKKQQKKISDLNTELKQHQKGLLKSQKRRIMMAELQKDEKSAEEGKTIDSNKDIAEKETKVTDKNMDINTRRSREEMPGVSLSDTSMQPGEYQGIVLFKNRDGVVILKGEMSQGEKLGVDTDKEQVDETKEERVTERETKATDTGMSHEEIHTIISADASAQQTSLQGTVMTKIKGDIAVLKGEIDQDERHGVNTDKKQAELDKLEKREEQARTFSISDKENRTMKSPTKKKFFGAQSNAENNAFMNVSKVSGEEAQVSQQRFYVSLGN